KALVRLGASRRPPSRVDHVAGCKVRKLGAGFARQAEASRSRVPLRVSVVPWRSPPTLTLPQIPHQEAAQLATTLRCGFGSKIGSGVNPSPCASGLPILSNRALRPALEMLWRSRLGFAWGIATTIRHCKGH